MSTNKNVNLVKNWAVKRWQKIYKVIFACLIIGKLANQKWLYGKPILLINYKKKNLA